MPSILWSQSRFGSGSGWWGITQVTPPELEPVTLDQAKSQVRVDWEDEDDLIASYVTAARQYCEDVCGRRFIQQTLDLWLQDWPGGDRIFIPYPPLISVTHVKATDLTETVNIVDPATYTVNNGGDLPEVVLRYGQIWPGTVLSPSRPINVQFVAGYGEDAPDVPGPIKQAILLLVGHWYTNREAVVIGRTATASVRVQDTIDALLARYKMPRYSADPFRP